MYGSAIYLRANSNVDIDGRLIVRGNNIGSQSVPALQIGALTFATITANYAYVNENTEYTATIDGSSAPIIRAGITGYSANNAASVNFTVGVLGYAEKSNNSAIGVVGVGLAAGGWFETRGNSSSHYAIQAYAKGSNTRAAYFGGQIDVDGLLSIVGTLNVIGNITASGNVIAYNSSDATLKRNIVPITNALEKLHDISGYNYNWIPEYLEKHSDAVNAGLLTQEDSGVLAQEIVKHIPTAVVKRKDGTLAVNYDKIIPLLIQAIKELDRKIK